MGFGIWDLGFLGSAGDECRSGSRFVNRMVAAMPVAPARLALFLDVGNFTAGGHFAIATDDAPAPESGEAEKPDETHTPSDSIAEQYACR